MMSAFPLSRPFGLRQVTPAGVEASVDASAAERAELASQLDIPAVNELRGRFRVSGTPGRIRVAGQVEARVEQVCVVTLDTFECRVEEPVQLEFAAAEKGRRGAQAEVVGEDRDPPEELKGDSIDLGAITAEFLALGLDPYPRKPGASFAGAPTDPSAEPSPFATLVEARGRAGGG